MKIYPKKKYILDKAKTTRRIPIVGEKKINSLNVAQLFKNLLHDNDEAFLFESKKGSKTTSRYSFMGIPNNNYVKIENTYSKFKLNDNSSEVIGTVEDGWKILNFEEKVPSYNYSPHFWGGWVGYITYEASNSFENLPKRKSNELGLPDAYFMQVDRLFVYDHSLDKLKYIIAANSNIDCSKYEEYINEIKNIWKNIETSLQTSSSKSDSEFIIKALNHSSIKMQSNLSSNEYKNIVNKAKNYIGEGDIYQANLSQRFNTKFEGDPLSLYLKLCKLNPAPFSGYLKFSDFSIISSSPERLIKVHGNKLETRPIAGTRPRGDNPKKDIALTTELLLNEKERAEHLMLVDLERSDMGRVCKAGSINVTELMHLEQYSHVSHIVSNIEGQLRPDISIYELLKSLFPGGTITGCPKIRCMEIINELEPSSRGPYSGSFGYIGFNRQLDFNILIRTIFIKRGEATFHVGAGIVADSDPDSEYAETLSKAAAMIEVLSDQTTID